MRWYVGLLAAELGAPWPHRERRNGEFYAVTILRLQLSPSAAGMSSATLRHKNLVMGTDRKSASVCRYRYLYTFSVGNTETNRYAIECRNIPNYCNNVRGKKRKKTQSLEEEEEEK